MENRHNVLILPLERSGYRENVNKFLIIHNIDILYSEHVLIEYYIDHNINKHTICKYGISIEKYCG